MKAKYVLLTLITTTLLMFATATSVFACLFGSYQPETPKSLIR